jgi:hypothetical protein
MASSCSVFIIQLAASRMQFQSIGRQPDANFIQSAASQMQISFSQASHMQIASASHMQIASG